MEGLGMELQGEPCQCRAGMEELDGAGLNTAWRVGAGADRCVQVVPGPAGLRRGLSRQARRGRQGEAR